MNTTSYLKKQAKHRIRILSDASSIGIGRAQPALHQDPPGLRNDPLRPYRLERITLLPATRHSPPVRSAP